MSKKDYYIWFQNTLPKRIDELSCEVQRTLGFDSWQPDFTPESLDRLGEWFAAQVEARQRTQDEIQEISSVSSFSIDVPSEELTYHTFSLAMDIGMYLSQVFMKNHTTLEWAQTFGNKKDVSYGQPVLVGFGKVSFNPIWMIVTLA